MITRTGWTWAYLDHETDFHQLEALLDHWSGGADRRPAPSVDEARTIPGLTVTPGPPPPGAFPPERHG